MPNQYETIPTYRNYNNGHTIKVVDKRNIDPSGTPVRFTEQKNMTTIEVDPDAIYSDENVDEILKILEFASDGELFNSPDPRQNEIAIGYAALCCAWDQSDNEVFEEFLFNNFWPTRPVVDMPQL